MGVKPFAATHHHSCVPRAIGVHRPGFRSRLHAPDLVQLVRKQIGLGRSETLADGSCFVGQTLRRAWPYLRSTMRRIVSVVDTSARLPPNVS